MRDIKMLRSFNDVYNQFSANQATLDDVHTLTTLLRRYYGQLTDEQLDSLLGIIENIIESDIKLNDKLAQSGGYFAGNLVRREQDPFLRGMANKFYNNISINDVVSLIKYCRQNLKNDRSNIFEFYLRVPEVILDFNNSVLVNSEQFKRAQSIFASIIKKQLGL